MSDEIDISGKKYISSKRAAKERSYTQDYVGQLARGGKIEARRVGGLWYVDMESLDRYKSGAESYQPTLPADSGATKSAKTLVAFDGKEYISASRASEVTGYNQDYVGQLARSGKILSRLVGKRWYVEYESLMAHKREKDTLLAGVQVESVGLSKQSVPAQESISGPEPMKYTSDASDLMPVMPAHDESVSRSNVPIEAPDNVVVPPQDAPALVLPIRRISPPVATTETTLEKAKEVWPVRSSDISIYKAKKGSYLAPIAVGFLLVLIVVFLITASLNSHDSAVLGQERELGLVQKFVEFAEPLLSPEIVYKRGQ